MKDKDDFRDNLLSHLNEYLHEVQDEDGNWTIWSGG